MEKSQWDLKKIRFQRRRLTRLDDFVQIYQRMHDAQLREYEDTERSRKKVRKYFWYLYLLQNIVNIMSHKCLSKNFLKLEKNVCYMCIYYISSSHFEWKWNSGKRKVKNVKEYTFLH